MPLLDLIARLRSARALHMGRDFLRWWAGELVGTWQDVRERFWPRSRRPIRVTPGNDVLPVGPKGRTAIMVLPMSLGLVKQLRWPRMVRAHVRNALSLQLERHIPLRAEAVYWDYEVKPSRADDTHIDIDLCLVRRAMIDREVERLRQLGLRPVRAALSADHGETLRFNLLGETRVLPSIQSHAWNVRLATGAGVLLLMAVLLTAWQWHRERVEMESALDRAKAAARAVVGARETLMAHVEHYRALDEARHAPSAAEVLAELTRRLPREIWLEQFSMKESTLRIAGRAPAFGNVASMLEPSPLFHDVTLASSAPEGIGSGQDRFEIAVAIGREAAP